MWDIIHGTYRVYIAGDCHCEEVGNAGVAPRKLGKWWISFEGHLKLKVDKGKKTTSWIVLPPRIDFDAQCNCSKRELREPFKPVQKPTTPPGTTTTPGGTTPPPFPPAGARFAEPCQNIQDEINADTDALAEAQREVDRLAGELEGAKVSLAGEKEKLAAVKAGSKEFDVTPEQIERKIQEIEGNIKGINRENERLYALQVRLMGALRDLATSLEECIKKHCPKEQACPTPPNGAVPPAKTGSGVSYEQDPFANGLLAYHNKLRTEVGSPPLQWSSALTDHAQGPARTIADTGQPQHSSA